MKTGDFDRAEIDKAIKILNNYKLPVSDNSITVEAIKYSVDELVERLLQLASLMKNWLKAPCDWIRNLIVQLP